MFKKLVLLTVVAIGGLSGGAAVAHGNYGYHTENYADDEHVMPVSGDRWVPWPFHLAQPFPWQSIQGTWKVQLGEYVSYFSFKVVNYKIGNVKQLQVKQYDGETCRIIASGVGLERNSKVFAQMTSKAGMTYRVQLTALSRNDSPVQVEQSVAPLDEVMVLSMGNLGVNTSNDMHHMQILKLSPTLRVRNCIDDLKNN